MFFRRNKSMARMDGAVKTSAQEGRLAIVAGASAMPLHIAESAARAGENPFILTVEGESDADFSDFEQVSLPVYALGRMCETARQAGVTRIAFAGNFRRPDFNQIRIEWGTVKVMPQLMALRHGGDDEANNIVAKAVEALGFELVGPLDIAPDIVARRGRLANQAPSKRDLADIEVGMRAIRHMGGLDIGQAVVVAARRIIAVEAAEGTDAMTRRCAELRENGRLREAAPSGVLVKAAKPRQERRLDLPTVGTITVQSAKIAGLAGIAVEAGSVLLPEYEAMRAAADAAGMFIYGVEAHAG